MPRSVLAQTPTPTLMLAFRSCGIKLRAQGMCAHTCVCTLSQGCVIPAIQLQAACLCGLRVSRHSFAPATVPLGSSPTGLCPRWTPSTGAGDGAHGKPSDPCPLAQPEQTRQLKEISLLTASATSTNLCAGLLPSLLSCCASCSSPPLPSSLTASAPTSWLLHTP